MKNKLAWIALFLSVLCLGLLSPAIIRAQLGVKATAHSVQLAWNASTVPTGAPAVSSYNVYRGTAAGAETLLATAGLNVAYTDATVVAGTTYFYEVTAVNSAGESGKSNEVSALIPNAVAPNAPTGLTGSAQ